MLSGNIQEITRNENVLVTTANSIIAEPKFQPNPRKNIVIRNISTNTADVITVNFGYQQAVANAGFVLQKGESIADTTETGYECFQGTITAICATANGVLAIFER